MTDILTQLQEEWQHQSQRSFDTADGGVRANLLRGAIDEIERLRAAAQLALTEMCNTVSPRDSFTDAVDALDAALKSF